MLEQFSKKANLYFLFIGIMQTLPAISISENMPVIILPLSFILFISAIKDFYEDYKRKKSDREENQQKIFAYENGKFVEKKWRQIRVGNIIRVSQDHYVPADLILLSVNGNNGTSYIETKNLDGETNLKIKTVHPDLRHLFENEKFDENRVIFEYERPNPYLYSFSGNFCTDEGKTYSLELSNFVLRGCSIKNTKSICGFVAYTGHETKIMLNLFKPKGKRSNLELRMSRQILNIFIIQLIICTLSSIIYMVWYIYHQNYLPYLSINSDETSYNYPGYNFAVGLGGWILIFTNFVPISLMVTLEAVKLIQGIIMSTDSNMKTDGLPLTVQSSNLNEELGQIKFVFSDKTGTLTCNKMDFKKIMINGKTYGNITEDQDKYIKEYQDFPKVTNVDFHDMNLLEILNDRNNNQYEIVKHTMFFLALCHSVVAENKGNEVIYNTSSPDEIALINFAKFCGFEFKGLVEGNYLLVEFKGQIYQFKLLQTFDFDSSRKRQSIIFENEDQEIFLYCKGADSVLENQLSSSNNHEIFDRTWNELKEFGCQGLRTLVLAERTIKREEYDTWVKEYETAKKSLAENRAIQIGKLQDNLERNLMLIGATAIQDKLQEGAADTIKALKNAQIKVWVLTGDKIETAINIGYACGLLDNSMQRFIIEDKCEGQLEQSFENCLTKIQNIPNDYNALIIHGDSLIHTLIKPFLCDKMIKICSRCISVLCCRVSPKQKQEIVTLMRSKLPDHSTLAIGDGANDVNMITAAHVGIGIKGLEGQQAARASDYSISEFRFLRRLLFYHGRECYRRNCTLVLYNIFKNIILVMPQFWFGIFNVFSGQTLYDSIIYQLFNIFYTSCPIMIYAVIDKEFNPKILMENNLNYYAQGMNNALFNGKIFAKWLIYGALYSLIITMFSVYSIDRNFINEQGLTQEFWESGFMIFGQCVLISNLKIMEFSHTFNMLSVISIILSLIIYLVSILIVNTNDLTSDLYAKIYPILRTPNFHFGNLLIAFSTCSVDIGYEMYRKFKLREVLMKDLEEWKEDSKIMKLKQSKMIFESCHINFLPPGPDEIAIKDQVGENEFDGVSQMFIGRKNEKKSTDGKNSMIIRSRYEHISLSPSNGHSRVPLPLHGEIVTDVNPHLGFAISQDTHLEDKNEDLNESKCVVKS